MTVLLLGLLELLLLFGVPPVLRCHLDVGLHAGVHVLLCLLVL